MMRVLVIAFVVTLSQACYRVPLEPHACPCVDGFVCVDDRCVPQRDDDNQQSGVCPQQFLRSDACATTPPAAADLIAVCDDGNSAPDDLAQELGPGGGQCLPSSLDIAVVSSTVTGTIQRDDDGGVTTVRLELDGGATYTVDVPEACRIDGIGCLQPDGSGSCDENGAGCRCTGVVLEHDVIDTLQQSGEDWFGAKQYFGCADADGNFLLREDGLGLGPIFVFAAR